MFEIGPSEERGVLTTFSSSNRNTSASCLCCTSSDKFFWRTNKGAPWAPQEDGDVVFDEDLGNLVFRAIIQPGLSRQEARPSEPQPRPGSAARPPAPRGAGVRQPHRQGHRFSCAAHELLGKRDHLPRARRAGPRTRRELAHRARSGQGRSVRGDGLPGIQTPSLRRSLETPKSDRCAFKTCYLPKNGGREARVAFGYGRLQVRLRVVDPNISAEDAAGYSSPHVFRPKLAYRKSHAGCRKKRKLEINKMDFFWGGRV